MELPQAYRVLDLSVEERALFRVYTRNLLRRGFSETAAVTVAFHALDICDKRIARVLEKRPAAVNQAVRRARDRLDVRGKGMLVHLIRTRPAVVCAARFREHSGQRPFSKNGGRISTNRTEIDVD